MTQPIVALVADDDPLIVDIVTAQLESAGALEVHHASSGRAALDQIAGQPAINLIVCDLRMPDLDGVELLRSLEASDRQFSLILISSLGDKILRSAEQLAQARGFRLLGALTKPIRRQELARLLDADMNGDVSALNTDDAAGPDIELVRQALEARALEVFVQPQIEVRSRNLEAVEVLTRWTDPRISSFSPGSVIGVCEQHGMIDDLTDVIVNRAGTAWRWWQSQELTPKLCFNVSARSLTNVGFPEHLRTALERHAITPDQVVIEVTETALSESLATSLDVVTRLRVFGFDLSIDDFGTGYSNLAKLRSMPFEELKIDLSFVAGLPHDKAARTIVESSIRLAHDLGLRTVAEGVENEQQLQALDDMSCDLAQGYFIGRPMPVGDFPDWVGDWLRRYPPSA